MSWGNAVAAMTQLGGTGAELAGQYYSQKRQMSESRRASARQLYASEYIARNGPSWAIDGLKKAGLNPILAATGGGFASPSVGTVPMSGQLSTIGQGLGESGRRLGLQYQEHRRLKAEADAAAEQKANIQAQAEAARESAGASSHQANLFARQFWTEIQREADFRTRAQLNSAQKLLADQNREESYQRARVLDAQTAKEINQAKAIEYTLPSAKAMAEFDASPEGQALIKVKRALELPKGYNLGGGATRSKVKSKSESRSNNLSHSTVEHYNR